MGRSSHGKSPDYRPGRGNPIAGRRFAYGDNPAWPGLFGNEVEGQYGPRLRDNPAYRPLLQNSMMRIRDSAADQVRNIRENLYALSPEDRQDYLDRAWIQAESSLAELRDQYVLYRHTPLEPVLNQAIKSQIYVLKNIEDIYG